MATQAPLTSERLAAELASRLAALQRVLRRRTRASLGTSPLSPAQVELLRLVAVQPGIRVGEAARELRLARNTVSTLAGQLADQGLLASERNGHDARGVHLRATPGAKRRLQRWRTQRARFLADAVDQLTDEEQHSVESVLPLLGVLTELVNDSEFRET
jgi:DNA-binding MarR family transcriptional regulator